MRGKKVKKKTKGRICSNEKIPLTLMVEYNMLRRDAAALPGQSTSGAVSFCSVYEELTLWGSKGK
ncbi:hypothetical protein J6590_036922 [Homalodisca vitripennis]|nr:hypothetical protein J6590_036922 [Homalodisca vitripennis]